MLYLCEHVGIASCSSQIPCSYNLTLGSISSVYPDSVNGQDFLLVVSSSSFRPTSSSFVTSLHSGMILDNKVPTPALLRSRYSRSFRGATPGRLALSGDRSKNLHSMFKSNTVNTDYYYDCHFWLVFDLHRAFVDRLSWQK
jgi:hypothetical protein